MWDSFVGNQEDASSFAKGTWTYMEPPLFPSVISRADAEAVSDVPPLPKKAARIGIVRLCDYDPMLSPFTSIAARNSLKYARKHGYKLYMEGQALDFARPIAWSKVCALIDMMPGLPSLCCNTTMILYCQRLTFSLDLCGPVNAFGLVSLTPCLSCSCVL